MPENSSDRLVLDVYCNAVDGRTAVALAQLDADDRGTGYRLAGPKHYNSGTTPVLSQELDARDAVEIRRMLDAVFPVPARVVEDWRELETLPVGTIGVVGEGVATQRDPDGWYLFGDYLHVRHDADSLIEECGPVTVLRVPGDGLHDVKWPAADLAGGER